MSTVENKFTFIEWINAELQRRGWSMRQLARKAGLSQTQVSNVLSGQRNITFEFCAAIAGPLGKTPEELFRMAGLLPTSSEPSKPEVPIEAMVREIYQALKTGKLGGAQIINEQRPGYNVEEGRAIQQLLEITGKLTDDQKRQFFISQDLPVIDFEDIMEIIRHLDIIEQRQVYDYARWRLLEQESRRNSSNKRSMPTTFTEEELIQLEQILARFSSSQRLMLMNLVLDNQTE